MAAAAWAENDCSRSSSSAPKRKGCSPDEHQHAEQAVLVEDRRAVQAAQTAGPGPVAGDEAAVGEDVVDGQRPALDRDPAHRALAEPELVDVLHRRRRPRRRDEACMRSVRLSSSASQNATNGALMISAAASAMEVSTSAGVERRGDQVVEAGQRAQPRGPRLGRAVQARVLQRDAGLGREALQQGQVVGQERLGVVARAAQVTTPACTRPPITTRLDHRVAARRGR